MTPTTTRRRFLASAAGATGIVLAGCVGDDDGSGELGDPAKTVDVEIMTWPRPDLEPKVVHVEPRGSVTWVGLGMRNAVVAYHPETHTYQRIPDGAEPWNSGIIREDDRFEWTFESEGVYDYADPTAYCSTHETVGVVGRVVVGWPDLDSEPAFQHDPDELPSRAATVMKTYNEECRTVLQDQ